MFMMILNEQGKTIIIDNLYMPLISNYLWVLDLALMDYALVPFNILEEITCSSITLEIFGFEFTLPSNWYVLIYDEETTQVDVVQVSELAGSEFNALIYGPKMTKPSPGKIRVVDYHAQFPNVGPSLNKHQMLCHPVASNAWISVSSTDVYNKYLKDVVLADIV